MLSLSQLFGREYSNMIELMVRLHKLIATEHLDYTEQNRINCPNIYYDSADVQPNSQFRYVIYGSCMSSFIIILIKDIVLMFCKFSNKEYLTVCKTASGNMDDLVAELKKYVIDNNSNVYPVIISDRLDTYLSESSNYSPYLVNDMSELVVCGIKSAR